MHTNTNTNTNTHTLTHTLLLTHSHTRQDEAAAGVHRAGRKQGGAGGAVAGLHRPVCRRRRRLHHPPVPPPLCVYIVVFKMSIPAQIRQLILYQ